MMKFAVLLSMLVSVRSERAEKQASIQGQLGTLRSEVGSLRSELHEIKKMLAEMQEAQIGSFAQKQESLASVKQHEVVQKQKETAGGMTRGNCKNKNCGSG